MKLKFKKAIVQINIKVKPEHLAHPELSINNYLESFLLRHTLLLGGIPLTYKVLERATKGIIDNRSMCVYLPAKVSFLLLVLNIGDKVECTNGLTCNLFKSKVEGDTNFTGKIIIKSFYEENDLLKIIGEKK